MLSYNTIETGLVLDRDFDDIESFDVAMFAKSKWLKIEDGIWGCHQSYLSKYEIGIGHSSICGCYRPTQKKGEPQSPIRHHGGCYMMHVKS